QRGSEHVEVLEGLREGERVILYPSDAVRDGVRITPPTQAGCLDGITRASVIQMARDLGYAVRETPSLAGVRSIGQALHNRGGGPLRLLGASGEGLAVEAGALEVPAGGRVDLRVTGDGATLCLATDDPDAPVRTFAVTPEGAPPVGEPAPDFALPDLDGVEHRLSEQLGNPVLLAYFATW
ncbi:MAG: aminotransferase class IV, partial [Myxococcota bacterium]